MAIASITEVRVVVEASMTLSIRSDVMSLRPQLVVLA